MSYRTAARVLSGKPRLRQGRSLQRAEQIQQIARRLNYRPNAAARAVATGRFGAVGFLTGVDAPRYLPGSLVLGVERGLAEQGRRLVVGQVADERLASEDHLPEVLREWSVDGLLVHYPHHYPPRLQRMLADRGICAVWINARLPHDAVFPDDSEAARAAVRHLVGLGHRRIAYTNHAAHGHYSEEDRRQGYIAAMHEAGLSPRLLFEPVPWRVQWDRLAAARDALCGDRPPTAVISYDAGLATAFFCAAMQLGLRVPDDLSLVRFHDDVHSDLGLEFTTMRVDFGVVGARAANVLHGRLAGSDPAPAEPVPLTFQLGQTIAPPKVA